MNLAQQFNSLNGMIVSRKTLELLLEKAEKEKHTIISKRVIKVLEAFDDDKFLIEIQNLVEPFGLNGSDDVQGLLGGLDFIPTSEDVGLGKAVSPSEIYDMVTQKMIDLINAANKGDYKRAWKTTGYSIPYNFVSKKGYRGINAFMLAPFFELLDNPYYLTFKQVKDLGGSVKKGAHGHEVVYYSTFDKKYTDEQILRINAAVTSSEVGTILKQGDTKTDFFLKYYNVFNGSDIEGIDFDLDNFKLSGKVIANDHIDGKDNQKLELAEAIVANYPSPKPPIYFQGSKAFYSPSKDSVTVPKITEFDNSQSFYRTLLHELSHSTGHESRLKRDFSGKFGSKEYAFEELVAEFGAVFLSAQAGIMFYTNKNHAGYLKGWNEVLVPQLENDNRFLMKAASQAQKLADFVLQPDANGEFLFIKNGKIAVEKVVATKKAATKKVITPIVKKPISKKVVAPKKVTPKNKFGKNELVKVIYGECKNHIGKILHCSFDESNGVFYYDIENACKDEISENNLAVATVLKTVAKKVEVVAEPKKASGIFELSISNVKTDTARFQNRNKLNETVLDQIVENYSDTKMDPIIVWIDKDKKTYLLAGHHRFEATKRVGRKTIAAKYFEGTEAEAIKYAKLESNANRSLELPQERAKLYREMRTNGATKTAVSNEAKKLEGKNANYILNLSYLQPKGLTILALDQLSETADKQNATLIEKIADWSGEARRNNDDLTNQHEKEIFDFLMDREASKRINSKSEFLQKIVAATGMYFDYETGLNLKRFKNQTEGESIYEAEYNELKNKIDSIIANRFALVDRIKNPNNKEYINPAKEKNYESILEALDKTVLKYNSELKAAQTKLIELSRKKGSYTNAGSNQVGLFGAKTNKNSLAYKMANKPTNIDFFKIEDQHIADFLGKIEHKKKESIVISLTGGQGSMKTRMCFQFINALAQNYKVGHASIEEHPESSLYYDKAEEYLNKKALQNIESPEIKSVSDLEKLIQKSEIIVIDSFSKMQEMQRGFEVDKDLRKKYDGKLFIVIFQQTTDGKMRGGSKSQFDADIVLFTEKKADYRENYIYADKNRYQNKPLDSLKFNIFSKKLVLDITEELGEPTTNKKLSFKVN